MEIFYFAFLPNVKLIVMASFIFETVNEKLLLNYVTPQMGKNAFYSKKKKIGNSLMHGNRFERIISSLEIFYGNSIPNSTELSEGKKRKTKNGLILAITYMICKMQVRIYGFTEENKSEENIIQYRRSVTWNRRSPSHI